MTNPTQPQPIQPAMPQPAEDKVRALMDGALVRRNRVILQSGAPADVFAAARALGFNGRLRVIRGTDYVSVALGEVPFPGE